VIPYDLYEKFIKQIEAEYGGTYSDADHKAIRNLLEKRVWNERKTMEAAMLAVKEWASKMKGLPDCAVIRQALDRYEEENQISLRPKEPAFNSTLPSLTEINAEKEEAQVGIYAEAEKRGINVHEEGWMLKYFYALQETQK